MQIDTSYSVATPEGISLNLTPAGPVPRLYAWVIDLFIRLVLYLGLTILLGYFGKFGAGITSIIIFFIEWFYPVFFEVLKNGQTPGKKSMGIYVAQESGAPVTTSASMIRNIIRFVDFLPFLYGFAFISMLLTNKFQRLGDLAANTVVLYLPNEADKAKQAKDLDTYPAAQPQVSFTLKEQQALISFSNRMNSLNKERSAELASLTGDLVKSHKEPVNYLYSVANWLVGKR